MRGGDWGMVQELDTDVLLCRVQIMRTREKIRIKFKSAGKKM